MAGSCILNLHCMRDPQLSPVLDCSAICSYFAGVLAVLQSLGIINNTTKLAGASGGAITAAALCSGIPATRLYAANMDFTAHCRVNMACRGTLDSAVKSYLDSLLPQAGNVSYTVGDAAAGGRSNVTDWCRQGVFVSMTHALPNNLSGMGQDQAVLVTNFSSKQQLIDAAAGSAYLPFWSSPSGVTQFEGLPVYDGGLSYPLPCPVGG